MNGRFKVIRERLGKSQQVFATDVGLSISTVSGFESGRALILSSRVRSILASAYGVTLEEIDADLSRRRPEPVSA